MPSFSADRDVRHSALDMLTLVADVEKYPDFVPLCEALRVRDRTSDDGRTYLVSDMTIAFAVFRETFSTNVTIDPGNLAVTVTYLNGPFRHLESAWTFWDTGPNTSTIRFEIDYEFKSPLLASLMGASFSRAFESFSDAFVTRADEIYGTGDVKAG